MNARENFHNRPAAPPRAAAVHNAGGESQSPRPPAGAAAPARSPWPASHRFWHRSVAPAAPPACPPPVASAAVQPAEAA